MNLYLVVNPKFKEDHWAYDSAVIAAESEEAARLIPPWHFPRGEPCNWNGKSDYNEDSWPSAAVVKVTLLGKAVDGTLHGVICASFNKGG